MKKTMLALIAALAFAGISANAANKIEQPIWDCALTFTANGGGVQFILGSFSLVGPGKIRCVDIAGNHQDMDVKVTLGATPVALNIAIGKMQLTGVASGIGVATGPEALLGKYYTASAEAGILMGVGANMSVRGGAEAVTLNLGVNLVQGTGFQMGLNRLKIEAVN